MSDRSSGGASRALRWWAGGWAMILATVFVGVTLLTLVTWSLDRDGAETDPVSDMAFLSLGLALASGLLSQIRWPQRWVAGLAQAGVAAFALALAGLAGRRIEPFVGGIVMVAVVAIAAQLGRSGRTWPGCRRPADPVLGGLAVVAAFPGLWHAAHMLDLALDSGPSCFAGQCARGDRYAETAGAVIAVVAITAVASARPPGWRLSAWTAGLSAMTIGGSSVALPDAGGSVGTVWGMAAVGWGILVVLAGVRTNRGPTS